MGDYCECIIPTDKRFKFGQVDKRFHKDIANLPLKQIEYLKDVLYQVKDKIIALIPGNHEEKFKQYHYVDPLYELCRHLEAPQGQIMSFIKLKFDRSQFHTSPVTFWCHHGWFGSGRKKGSKVNNLEDIANGYDADIYCVGHSHMMLLPPQIRYPSPEIV